MKTSKSPENKEVTPSKKKLTQARLPFKIISDASPKAVPQQPRKRKLSTPNAEPVSKIGKISKENGIDDDPVVISDDECKQQEPQQDEKQMMNPFVKLVDTAFKKKQQKTKKKKNEKKKKEIENSDSPANLESSECEEAMEIDNPSATLSNGNHELNDDDEKRDCSVQDNKKIISEKNYMKSTNDSVSPNEVPESLITDSKTDIVEESNDAETPEDNVIYEETDKNVIEKSNSSTISNEVKTKNSEENNEIDSEKPEESQETTDMSKINVLTPKRSSRSRAKQDKKSNLNSSKLNESTTSAPSTPKTPKNSRSSSVSNSVGNESLNDSTASLTPKQQQKKLESAKKREEREKDKQEREKKRQQEKEERVKLKQEKEEQKKREREEKEEAKKKEKEEKEEQKRKEKEEKEKQKEMEKKLREEKEDQKRKEKEEKEEQRKKEKEAREEEKRKKQEALELEKQEQELKKKKAAEAFVNFFVPKQKSEKDQATIGPVSKNNMLSSFTIKADMRLAPTVRTDLTDDKRQNLDCLMEKQNEDMLYLKSLRQGVAKPLSSGKTWPLEDKDDDVMIIEDELPPIDGAGEIMSCDSAVRENLRPKLLSFHENRRPPYWGTWRKKSAFVKPRKPFGQDQKQLDYEADSDEEWEEEQEGESIDGSAAGSDDEQDADEYEVDNEVFVPHGYLSDEEATMDEDDNDNVLSLSPDTQKARLKHLEDEFESEMKKPTEKLKPRLYGLLWENSDGGKPENCVDALWNYFGKLSMIMGDPTTLLKPSKEPEEGEKKKVKKRKTDGDKDSPKVEKKKKTKTENKEKPKPEVKKNTSDSKKNQPGINSFLKKVTSS